MDSRLLAVIYGVRRAVSSAGWRAHEPNSFSETGIRNWHKRAVAIASWHYQSAVFREARLTRIRLSFRATLVASIILATPAAGASFPTVVRNVLDAQTDGRLAKMGRDQRARMTDCVIATLAGLPGGKKRYITEGATLDEQQDRFGEVVQEDRAKWKQKIATACSKIAVESTSTD